MEELKYSSKEFEGYKFRAVVVVEYDYRYHKSNIFTTDTDQNSVIRLIKEKVAQDVDFVQLDDWCSKEECDLCSEMLEKMLEEYLNR